MKKLYRFSIILLFLAVSAVAAFIYFQKKGALVPAGITDTIVLIPTGASFEQVVDSLQQKGIIQNEKLFRLLAKRMAYERNPMRAGRYAIEPGCNLVTLIRHLRGGEQEPVNVVLTNERLLENVAAKAARFVEADSLAFLEYLSDPDVIRQLGFTPDNLMSIFIPNSYQMYWNTTPEAFLKRMMQEHERFWNSNNRKQKAANLNMTPAEVYTLASIVEKETLVSSEKPRIAGVYLNRLRIGMLLQADPTSVFARRDFAAKRVTDYHTKYDNPYNTYMYSGLPPGPISMASISSIDGVLNPERHSYLYFCAFGDGSGKHAFAETLSAHNANAVRYRENVRRLGLEK